eukprot:16445239-Heterocapsa_arctica.AAC.1
MEFTTVPQDDIIAKLTDFLRDAQLWIDTVAISITKALDTPLLKAFHDQHLQSLLPAEKTTVEFYSIAAEGGLALTRAAKSAAGVLGANVEGQAWQLCTETALISTNVHKTKELLKQIEVPCQQGVVLTTFLGICSQFVGAWAGKLVQEAKGRFMELMMQDMPADALFADVPEQVSKDAWPEPGGAFADEAQVHIKL